MDFTSVSHDQYRLVFVWNFFENVNVVNFYKNVSMGKKSTGVIPYPMEILFHTNVTGNH